MEKKGTVIGVSGPVVTVRTDVPASMFEVARVGEEGLLGEVIRVDEFSVRIQVYEDTNGLASGAPARHPRGRLRQQAGPPRGLDGPGSGQHARASARDAAGDSGSRGQRERF